MDKRDKLVELALLTLGICTAAASLNESAEAAPKKGVKTVECFGVNSCKGTNGCSINPDQIKVANKVFTDKFLKSKPVDCAGNSDCSAKSGFLAWSAKANDGECFGAGGFLLEKDKSGKFVVRDKAGAKS